MKLSNSRRPDRANLSVQVIVVLLLILSLSTILSVLMACTLFFHNVPHVTLNGPFRKPSYQERMIERKKGKRAKQMRSEQGKPKSPRLSDGVHRNQRYAQRMDVSRSGVSQSLQSSSGTGSLDFIVAGFPKCGTTTLLYAFSKHPETGVASSERCGIVRESSSDSKAAQEIDLVLQELYTIPKPKHGMKCPTLVNNYRALEWLRSHLPATKYIVGLRHPVQFIQSFYNYRVTEIYDKQTGEDIPTFDEVVRRKSPWKGVSLSAIRFDTFLMQFAKLNRNEIAAPSRIFIYTLDQLDDDVEERSSSFREKLQQYLDLKQPFAPFGHENTNHFTGLRAHPESVKICDAKYNALRQRLIKQGKIMASRIIELTKRDFVTVANRDHFLNSIKTWEYDPCTKNQEQLMQVSEAPFGEVSIVAHKRKPPKIFPK